MSPVPGRADFEDQVAFVGPEGVRLEEERFAVRQGAERHEIRVLRINPRRRLKKCGQKLPQRGPAVLRRAGRNGECGNDGDELRKQIANGHDNPPEWN